LNAFQVEAEQLSRALSGLSGPDWDRPTRCEPWRVRDLLAHLTTTVGRLSEMLAAPAPARAEVTAATYYRPDERFAPDVDAVRVDLARQRAEQLGGPALAGEFDVVWRRVDRACRAEPVDRLVATRFGDQMLLSEYLVTRVLELAVHGLDLADALGRRPWLTDRAADVVEELLVGGEPVASRALGWDRARFLRTATGRAPLTPEDRRRVERLGIRWLTFGQTAEPGTGTTTGRRE
jgi:uncharacterized protein (TIGR03083 family)